MTDLQTLVRIEMDRAGSPSYSFDELSRRRARKDRNRRIGAAVLGLALAVVTFAGLVRTLGGVEPADQPTDMFAPVHGWIVYEHWGEGAWKSNGIWAVNPTRPGHPKEQIELSDRPGEPLAWSSDGSKLLIWRSWRESLRRWHGLFVLHADGTETRLVVSSTNLGDPNGRWIGPQGSFSPDGSEVVYSELRAGWKSGIYVVDSDGGTPRLLRSPGRVSYPEFQRRLRTALSSPTFSPDGTQIAYFDGMGDWGNRLLIMNADGSGARVLIDRPQFSHIDNLVWSPDGSRLAFSAFEEGPGKARVELWVVGVDGSGTKTVIADATNPAWSPDGSRISYQPVASGTLQHGTLEIAALEGTRVTHVQEFGYAGSGAWNPLPLRSVANAERGATGATRIAAFVLAIAGLGLLMMFIVARRARRRVAAP
jgi:Tol biopolymer transport system component